MFTKEITNSDEFIDMPLSSQALYFHLAMNADDDGFVSPKSIIRMVQAKDDDLKILLFKKFVICFETGVIVISHWKCNNTLRWDRYKQTLYQNEYKQLCNNGWVYTMATVGIPNGNQMATVGMHSIVESSIVESREDKNKKEIVVDFISEIEKLKEQWNELPDKFKIPKAKKISPSAQKRYKILRKEYTLEEIKAWFQNYVEAVWNKKPWDTYYDHRYYFSDFIENKYWLEKYASR